MSTPTILIMAGGTGGHLYPAEALAAELLDYYGKFDMERFGLPGGPLHDPTVLAALLRPDLLQFEQAYVEISTLPGATIGQSMADWYGMTNNPPNCRVARRLDADGFYEFVGQLLSIDATTIQAA